QRWPRYASPATLPRAQEHSAHGQVHRDGARRRRLLFGHFRDNAPPLTLKKVVKRGQKVGREPLPDPTRLAAGVRASSSPLRWGRVFASAGVSGRVVLRVEARPHANGWRGITNGWRGITSPTRGATIR